MYITSGARGDGPIPPEVMARCVHAGGGASSHFTTFCFISMSDFYYRYMASANVAPVGAMADPTAIMITASNVGPVGAMADPTAFMNNASNVGPVASIGYVPDRQLLGWTQTLGERCDMVSYCEFPLQCNNGVFGTGKCVEGESQPGSGSVRQLIGGPTSITVASHEGRKLSGYTQSLGEPCDMVSYCKTGLKCTNDVFGTGKCKRSYDRTAMDLW